MSHKGPQSAQLVLGNAGLCGTMRLSGGCCRAAPKAV